MPFVGSRAWEERFSNATIKDVLEVVESSDSDLSDWKDWDTEVKETRHQVEWNKHHKNYDWKGSKLEVARYTAVITKLRCTLLDVLTAEDFTHGECTSPPYFNENEPDKLCYWRKHVGNDLDDILDEYEFPPDLETISSITFEIRTRKEKDQYQINCGVRLRKPPNDDPKRMSSRILREAFKTLKPLEKFIRMRFSVPEAAQSWHNNMSWKTLAQLIRDEARSKFNRSSWRSTILQPTKYQVSDSQKAIVLPGYVGSLNLEILREITGGQGRPEVQRQPSTLMPRSAPEEGIKDHLEQAHVDLGEDRNNHTARAQASAEQEGDEYVTEAQSAFEQDADGHMRSLLSLWLEYEAERGVLF